MHHLNFFWAKSIKVSDFREAVWFWAFKFYVLKSKSFCLTKTFSFWKLGNTFRQMKSVTFVK